MIAWTRLLCFLSVLGGGCNTGPAGGEDAGPGPVTHRVTINADGSFSPQWTYVRSGDTVEWTLHDHTDTIIPSTWSGDWPAVCATPQAYDAADPNGFVGPMPVAPGGVFALNPNPKPPGGGTLPTTWADPAITGVYLRMLWSDVEPSDGGYDFTALDHELDAAVASGKVYSLAFEAGAHGTPTWLAAAGVTPLHLQDTGSNPANPAACGADMILGAPWGATYSGRYFDMLRAVAAHLKTRADWYRALAYIKPSGANLFTEEARLPKDCQPGCICNDAVWSAAGYTPANLEGYFARQLDVLAAAFPGKTMSYQLIQAGFPRINDQGGYVDANGVLTAGTAREDGTIQTEDILDDGQARFGTRFAVQHNGLQPVGAPNRWVTDEGSQGQYTGFQTQNNSDITDLPTLDAALRNGRDHSGAVFIEIYEERVREAELSPGPLDPSSAGSGLDLAGWDALYRGRRDAPVGHSHTFSRTQTGGDNQLLYYTNGTKCGGAGANQYGVVVIQP